ncbi:hypothetical protein N780_18035 [Pontibacillus chungwhensis BH030062]|uniref:Uncharacterized protein n=1 Tax=Pontibacillus chungwhensis BH030062 TaxID=1385513 RepID=A0A0A2UY86_9BACI|nr:hypothetical protein N780_18035 [Pontibacillus chungwhensis BH030062]
MEVRAGLGTTRFPAGSWEASSIATRFPGSPLGSLSRGSLAVPKPTLILNGETDCYSAVSDPPCMHNGTLPSPPNSAKVGRETARLLREKEVDETPH